MRQPRFHNDQWNIKPAPVGHGDRARGTSSRRRRQSCAGVTTQSNEADQLGGGRNSNDTIQDVIPGSGRATGLPRVVGGNAAGRARTGQRRRGQDQIANVITRPTSRPTHTWPTASGTSPPVTSVGSDGGGDVTQSNEAANAAEAINDNITDQFVNQDQAASGRFRQSQAAILDNGPTSGPAPGSEPSEEHLRPSVGGDTSPGANSGSATAENTTTPSDVIQGQPPAAATARETSKGDAAGEQGSRRQGQTARTTTARTTTTRPSRRTSRRHRPVGRGVVHGQVYVHRSGRQGSGDVTQSNSATNEADGWQQPMSPCQGVRPGPGGLRIGSRSGPGGQRRQCHRAVGRTPACTTASTTSTHRCSSTARVPDGNVTQSNKATNEATAATPTPPCKASNRVRRPTARASGGPASGSTPRCSTPLSVGQGRRVSTSRPTSTPRCSSAARVPAARSRSRTRRPTAIGVATSIGLFQRPGPGDGLPVRWSGQDQAAPADRR